MKEDPESEGCIVPMKPGNSGGGKAAERWRDFIAGVSESSSEYDHSVDYEHEHRDAEHVHEEEPGQAMD